MWSRRNSHHQLPSFHWADGRRDRRGLIGALTSHMDRQQESWNGHPERALCLQRNSAARVLSLLCQLYPCLELSSLKEQAPGFPLEQLSSHDQRTSWSTSSSQVGVLQRHPCPVQMPRELLRLRFQSVQARTHCFRHFPVLHQQAVPGKRTSILTFTRQAEKLREHLSR